jgi:chorismate mutase
MAMHALRGAITVDVDTADQVTDRTMELLAVLLERNDLDVVQVLSVVFSATPDIVSVAPAVGARKLGLTDAAMICTAEMPVEGSLPLCVRLLAHIESDRPRSELQHVFLRGAVVLRPELAQAGDEQGYPDAVGRSGQ